MSNNRNVWHTSCLLLYFHEPLAEQDSHAHSYHEDQDNADGCYGGNAVALSVTVVQSWADSGGHYYKNQTIFPVCTCTLSRTICVYISVQQCIRVAY